MTISTPLVLVHISVELVALEVGVPFAYVNTPRTSLVFWVPRPQCHGDVVLELLYGDVVSGGPEGIVQPWCLFGFGSALVFILTFGSALVLFGLVAVLVLLGFCAAFGAGFALPWC